MKFTGFCLPIILAALVFAPLAKANKDIFKTVDKDGKVTFSDSVDPDKKAEEIELKELNTQPAVDVKARPRKVDEAPTNYNLSISTPANNYRVGPAEKRLSIGFNISKKLARAHKIQTLLNGKPMGSPTQSLNTSIFISKTMRGRRSLSAIVIDEEGRTISTAPAKTIYILRP